MFCYYAVMLLCACGLYLCCSRENSMMSLLQYFREFSHGAVLNYQLLASVELRIKLDRNECQRLCTVYSRAGELQKKTMAFKL